MTTTPSTVTEETVEVAGASVHVRRGGSGEPLLILHGELGVPGWLRAHEALAQHYAVHVPTLPGFGASSEASWMMGVRDMAAWVSWFVRDYGLPAPVNVVAHSLGGWLAAEIAAANAAIFKKMVLVAPAGLKPRQGEIYDYFMHSAKDAFRDAFVDPPRVPEYAEYYDRDWTPEEAEAVENNREMTSRLTWRPYMHSLTLHELLPAIATPTLLVWGRQDAIVPIDSCEQYQQGITGATTAIIDDCGHLPEMEQTDRFVDAITSFLG